MTEPAITSFTGEHGFLSNFDMGPGAFSVMTLGHGGAFVRSAEHAFQAHKTHDPAMQAMILNATSAKQAKRLGQQVRPLPDWWEQRKKMIMLEVLLAKFTAPWYRDRLIATGHALLVEGNTWGDDFWGAVSIKPPLTARMLNLPWWTNPDAQGRVLAGYNWLGRLLSMVRDVSQ